MSNLIKELSILFMHNEDCELVLIKNSQGSTPRKEGAMMIVTKNKKSFGTIGGGTVEFMATKKAVEFLEKKESGFYSYNLTQQGNNAVGMACGGDIDLEFKYLEASEENLEYVKQLDNNINFSGNVFIFGAGHVSICLAKILNFLDYDVVVFDDREDFANKERFPYAKRIIVNKYENIEEEKLNINKNDYVVIMTRGHVCDYEVEKQILKIDPYYIGVIGSKNKIKAINEKLTKDGFSKEQIDKVCTPIGLPIGAETPEEIAISIAAQIIFYKAKKENRSKIK